MIERGSLDERLKKFEIYFSHYINPGKYRIYKIDKSIQKVTKGRKLSSPYFCIEDRILFCCSDKIFELENGNENLLTNVKEPMKAMYVGGHVCYLERNGRKYSLIQFQGGRIDPVVRNAFKMDDNTVVVNTGNGQIYTYNLQTRENNFVGDRSKGKVLIDANSEQIMFESDSCILVHWNGITVPTVPYEQKPYSLANCAMFAYPVEDHIVIHDLSETASIELPVKNVTHLSWSPDDQFIAVIADNCLFLTDVLGQYKKIETELNPAYARWRPSE